MTNGGNKLHQLYWMKIWQVNSSVKIHSLSPSHVWKLSSFFLQLKAVFTQSWIEELDHKGRGKTPCGFDAAFLPNVFLSGWETVCKKPLNLAVVQVTLSKIPRNEAKIYQERNFLALKDIFFTSPGCCQTSASSLDVVQVRFAWSVYRVLLGNDLSNL